VNAILSDSAILDGLTGAQRAAVTYGDGPLLVVAGAGTGKTSVLTRRIAYLIATKRARPEEILALTFTDKAAAEMEERVDVLVPYGYADVFVSTFHAFADRVLREHAVSLGLPPDFRVLTRSEQVLLLREHLFALPLERFRPLGDPTRFLHALAGLISRAKDEDVDPATYAAFAADLVARAREHPDDLALQDRAAKETEVAALYAAYQDLLARSGMADFGDQIALLLRLLRDHPVVREKLVRRFRYVVVDEFQDTNHAQFDVLRLLTGAERNLTVVADDDQSIYTFRGAESRNILAFLETFPDAGHIVLVENYRSCQEVLDAARRVIVFNNPDRLEVVRNIDKRLVSKRRDPVPACADGPAVRSIVAETVWEEADAVADEIARLVAAGVPLAQIAILVRSNTDADPFLRSLNMREIPWRFSGNQGLYARPEIALLRHVLRAIAHPEDAQSLYALAASGPYAIPPDVLAALLAAAGRMHRPLLEVMADALRAGPAPHADGGEAASGLAVVAQEDGEAAGDRREVPRLDAQAWAALSRLLDSLQRLRALAATRTTGEVLYAFLTESGWLGHLVKREQPGDDEAVQNIARFFEQVRRFGEVAALDRVPFFDSHLRATMAAGDDPPVAEADRDVDAVHVLTVHKAKGLEFTVVFLVGLVQGRFPARGRTDPLDLPQELIRAGAPGREAHIAEERRLFYVAMTRARDLLFLTAAVDYGGRRVRKVSQFVAEALDRMPPAPRPRLAPETAIAQHAFAGRTETPPVNRLATPEGGLLTLSDAEVDDFLTCPRRYQFVHVIRVPILRHHAVVYGNSVRQAIRAYLLRRAAGGTFGIDQLLSVYHAAWTSEGFLTRDHEDRRLAEGEAALRRFYEMEEAGGSRPTFVDRPFNVPVGSARLRGHWERVDIDGGEVEIVDYKSSDPRRAEDAKRRVREDRRLGLYALAWAELNGRPPDRLSLHFVGSGVRGTLVPTADSLEKSRAELTRAAEGIRLGDFPATPSEMICRHCAYASICPASAVPAA
jgi:DNA helicase-2/ATP-dependent DNA helicase PcrA